MTFHSFVRIVKNPFFLIIWLALMTGSYLFIDEQVAIFFHNFDQTHKTFTHIFDKITRAGSSYYYLIGSVILFLLSYVLPRKKILASAAIFIFLAASFPGVVCNLLKILLGRSRPSELFSHHMYGFYFWQFHNNMWSFPSGHTTTISGVTTALSFLLPRLWGIFFAVCLLVAASRVILTAHFVSDVMAGMYLGFIITYWLQQKIGKKIL